MNNTFKYYAICIPLRLSLSLFVYFFPQLPGGDLVLPKVVGSFLALLSVGSAYRFVSRSKKGFLGGDVWWNSLRLIHSFTFFLSAILLLLHPPLPRFAGVVLLLDTLVSLSSSFLLKPS